MSTSIAIDVHGGDNGISTTIPACLQALKELKGVSLILAGNQNEIQNSLDKHPDYLTHKDSIKIHHASQQVAMDEDLMSSMRKRDSSMRVSASLVKSAQAQAFVSAGNSGALMAISKAVLKTIDGIERPAMFSKLPTLCGGHTHMLDLGANLDSDSSTLYNFALMGSIAVKYTSDISNPRVGLLNIGSEEIKGKQIIKDTAQLLKNSHLNYTGFIEADTLYTNPVDVVVCDGFDGNLVLKASEGTAKLVSTYLKRSFTHNLYHKISALVARPALKLFKKSLDPKTYNGASLLGLKGIVIKSHGGADSTAFFYAIKEAYLEANGNIIEKITQTIQQHPIPDLKNTQGIKQ